MLVQLTAVILAIIAFGIIMVTVFNIPVSGVMTTSGVFIAIVGFALRNMISDLFTGIALGIERPFGYGDWIQLNDGTVGRVVEMNWRSTRLLTREEISVVIPNSELALTTFKNYSKPERAWRDEFDILLSHSVTAHQAERILLSAVSQVPEITAVNKPPEIRITEYNENGTIWQVRFWVPDYASMSRLRYEVQKAVLRNMHYAGLDIPPERVLVQAPTEEDSDTRFTFLRGVDLFDELSDDEIRKLMANMNERLHLRDESIVREGDAGDSLFIVKEGLLDVNIGTDGESITVAHLVPGSFFGEMSLLTGDPRHATVITHVDSVVYEIKQQDFEVILRARPEIARTLSEVLTERQSRNRISQQQSTAVIESENSLMERILGFFSLNQESEPIRRAE